MTLAFDLQVNYWPSSLDNVQTSPNSKEAQNISTATITGQRVKQVCGPTATSFSPSKEWLSWRTFLSD